MGALMWIEVLSRDGTVAQRQRVDAPEARIGRAFDNDVIVDDPHVAPQHLRIFRDADGGLVAEDLGSVNGLYAEPGARPQPRIRLADSPSIRIGRTVLRVHDASQPVPPEKPLTPARAHMRWAAALLAALFALVLLLNWLALTTQAEARMALLPIAVLAIPLLLWSGLWAAATRAFHGQAQFALHLRIAAAACIAVIVWDQLAETTAFAFAWRKAADHAGLGVWLILLATCYAHLRAMGARHVRALMAGLTVLVVAAAGLQYIGRTETRGFFGERATLGDLRPPWMRLAPLATTDEFLQRAEATRRRVDEARLKEPSSGGLLSEPDPND